jgi:hypothetical protein
MGRVNDMNVLVCGDRNWDNKEAIMRQLRKIRETYDWVVLIHGGARGADTLAAEAARELEFDAIIECPAKWKSEGRPAGPKRNSRMLIFRPKRVLAFHENIAKSKGTKNMIELAKKNGIKVKLYVE